MRNLYILLGKIINLVPESEVKFLEILKTIRRKSMYTAPECMYELWKVTDDAVNIFVFTNKKHEEWHYQVMSEWSMGNIDELKKNFEDRE